MFIPRRRRTKPTGPTILASGRWSTSAVSAQYCRCRSLRTTALLGYYLDLSPGGAAVLRQANCPVGEFRGPGGDRDGERAAAHRAAGSAGAADRDGRGVAGHQASPGNLAPVFDAMLEKAMRLCEAAYGILWTYDGETFRPAPRRWLAAGHSPISCTSSFSPAQAPQSAVILGGDALYKPSILRTDPSYQAGDPSALAVVEIGATRTLVIVALVKDDALLGVIRYFATGSPAVHRQADRSCSRTLRRRR